MSDPIAIATTNTVDNSLLVAHTPRLAKPWIVSDLLLPFMGEWESGVMNGRNFMHIDVTQGMILKVYLDVRAP